MVLAGALLLVGLIAGCSANGTSTGSGSSPDADASSHRLSQPRRLVGDALDLGRSGCALPAATVYIVRVTIADDGSTGEVRFTKGRPSECITAYVVDTVAGWRFEPPTLDGDATSVHLHQTLQTPR